MKRILVLFYSQSGDVERVTRAFVRPLAGPDVEICEREIRPSVGFPYPWRTLPRLLDVFPECITQTPSDVEPLDLSPDERFDLVVLSYQVWHFAPSLPVQGFLKSPSAELLRGAKVITLVTSRNMWQSASQTMKRMLADCGARHVDNVVVTHAGPPWTTFVTVPRGLLFGKKTPLWGIFPAAEIGPAQTGRIERLGAVVRDQLDCLNDPQPRPLLRDQGAVEMQRRYIIPERIAWAGCRAWSRLVLFAGRFGGWPRRLAIYLYLVYLVLMILIALPICILMTLVCYPLIRGRLNRYARELTLPSGGTVT